MYVCLCGGMCVSAGALKVNLRTSPCFRFPCEEIIDPEQRPPCAVLLTFQAKFPGCISEAKTSIWFSQRVRLVSGEWFSPFRGIPGFREIAVTVRDPRCPAPSHYLGFPPLLSILSHLQMEALRSCLCHDLSRPC